ncbi:DNA translocase FtsK [Candidatus Parcubacteria bacterium]|nr:DNA translocase FtsK [Candidatus Parcubacteria bacterium]
MAKKRKKKNANKDDYLDEDDIREPSLKEETIRFIYAILFFIAGLFLVFSALNRAGIVGQTTYAGLTFLLGIGYFLLPLLLFFLGITFLKSAGQSVAWPKMLGSFLFLLASLGTISMLLKDADGSGQGGLLGNVISSPLIKLFDFWVTLLFLIGLLIISAIITLDPVMSFESLAFWRKKKDEDELTTLPELKLDEESIPEERKPEPAVALAEESRGLGVKKVLGLEKKSKEGDFAIDVSRFFGKPYIPPPLSLLELDRGKPGVGDIKANANIIKRTLQNFGINVEMDEISIGPSVTRYALKPAEGVKLSRIIGLHNDLALALAAHPIRIEAPIPGKSLVGIEIPNSTKTTVGLGTLLGSEDFKQSDKPLLVSLGKGISGKSHFANLGKMPHLLIAGATGSGKSVTIHTILVSLLYRNSPENLKFIMIDPKRVELTLYNNIPHLLTPVITDAKKSILALKWAAKEMDRRYDILESKKVRDIESYHKTILGPALKKFQGKSREELEGEIIPESMPYIVIIIDELADLMQAYPRELESAIVRLAQMSRAVGIHLMLSTQRPSVNVITGLIKANVPTRIALQVASQIDSRTILDAAGAEKLLGAGDMLFQSGEMSKPQRIQSGYITEGEVKSVVKYLVDTYADELPNEINLTEGGQDKNAIFESSFGDDEGGDDDDLYEQAREIVVHAGKASTSYLQRKLRIGYARAARLIDMLEERGVIGPGDGAKPREVINPIAAISESSEIDSEV